MILNNISWNPFSSAFPGITKIPRGGRSTKGNVVVSCKDCNNRKKDSLFVDLPSEVAGLHEPGDQHQKEDQLDIVKPADSAPP